MGDRAGRKPVVLVLPDREIVAHLDAVLDAYRGDPALGSLVAAADEEPSQKSVEAFADALAERVGDGTHPDVLFLDGVANWLRGVGGSDLLDAGGPPAEVRARAEWRRTR